MLGLSVFDSIDDVGVKGFADHVGLVAKVSWKCDIFKIKTRKKCHLANFGDIIGNIY